MSTISHTKTALAIKFEYLNWIASDPLPRDQTRSIVSTRSTP